MVSICRLNFPPLPQKSVEFQASSRRICVGFPLKTSSSQICFSRCSKSQISFNKSRYQGSRRRLTVEGANRLLPIRSEAGQFHPLPRCVFAQASRGVSFTLQNFMLLFMVLLNLGLFYCLYNAISNDMENRKKVYSILVLARNALKQLNEIEAARNDKDNTSHI